MTRIEFWSEKLILPGRGVKFKFVLLRELLLDGQLLLLRWLFQRYCLTSCDIDWFFAQH